jgi:GcrA cell cycle regulator
MSNNLIGHKRCVPRVPLTKRSNSLALTTDEMQLRRLRSMQRPGRSSVCWNNSVSPDLKFSLGRTGGCTPSPGVGPRSNLGPHLKLGLLAMLNHWTAEQDERLRNLVAQGASIVRAAAALKRKIDAVRGRARKLGCPFPPQRLAAMGRDARMAS